MSMSTGSPDGWQEIELAGHRAWYRGMCGAADAVIFLDGRAYVMSAFTGRRPDADRQRLDEWAAKLTFKPKDAVD